MDSEFDLDNMTEVWPPVPPATLGAPAAEPGAGAAGVRKATPRHHRSPPGGTISVTSTAAVPSVPATTGAPAVKVATATTAGILPCSWGDLREIWRFSVSSRTAKRTHEVPVVGLDHERVLRGCPVGVCHEGCGSQEDHGEEGRGNRTSSRFTAGRAPGEGTGVARGAREAWCATGLKIMSYLMEPKALGSPLCGDQAWGKRCMRMPT